jgi:DNA invertase Pin-like site-specific DNA recombinase
MIDGYVRVSQVRGRHGDRFLSPAVQREQIEGWIAARGAQIGQLFEELDVSGARVNRPGLEQAIRRIECGASDGLVVAKLDRFGRSLTQSLAAIQRIQSAGGIFVSVQDGLDLATDTGRLIVRIMLSMAEWELDRIRDGWRAARSRAVARGVHMGGRAPTGYQHDDARRLRPHPDYAAYITELFARRAQRETLERLAAFLSQNGVPSAYSAGPWTAAGVRVVLSNRVYLGELHSGEFILEGAHAPLTDAVTWQIAQSVRPRVRSRHGRPALLNGLVLCGSCRRLMQTHSVGRSGLARRVYVCRRDDCVARVHINGAVLEPYVEACFFALLEIRDVPAELEGLEQEAARAHDALVAFRDNPAIAEALGSERFVAGLAGRARDERRALGAVAAARDRLRVLEPGGREVWEQRWPQLGSDERREAMARLIEHVEVSRGFAPVERRAAVLPRGRQTTMGSPGPPRLWGERRIEAALREYVADEWPRDEEFTADGRGPLLAQVHATGGPARWARRIAAAARPRARGYWSDDRIHASLTVLLAGRSRWPTHRELSAWGYSGLYAAMQRRGRRAWEAEFGFAGPRGAGEAHWTEQNVSRALVEFTRGRKTYPSRAEFQLAGLDGLHQAIRLRHGGHDRWAQRLGLPRAGGRSHRKSVLRWTDALVEQRLRALVRDLGMDRYPLRREFLAAGEGGLYRRIKVTDGHASWARRVGVPRTSAQAAAAVGGGASSAPSRSRAPGTSR